MSVLSLRSVVVRNDEITTADMDGETVMLNIETGKYFGLGDTGSVIWKLLESPLDIDTLVGKLQEEYDVERECCVKDVLAFLEEAVRERVVLMK